ncbi:LacI family DNA-binding transcriptional regulator [Arthrobacter sp. SA17]
MSRSFYTLNETRRNMKEQQRRPTLMDVAQAAGVSRALVSIVMRGAPGAAESTRQKVFQAARELGYRPDSRARLLRSSRTKLIGLSFSSSQPFHAEIVDAAYAQASSRGYEIALSAVANGRTETRAVESLLDFGSEALVMISPTLSAQELSQYSGQVPVVSLLRNDVGELVDAVSSDDHAGIRLGVEHLAGLGHHKIVHVDGGTAVSAQQRTEAFLTEMRGRGLKRQSSPAGQVRRMACGQPDSCGTTCLQLSLPSMTGQPWLDRGLPRTGAADSFRCVCSRL